ncbi:MAG: 50S ribosomal protein L6 [Planctomycetota bacterium]
MSRIGKKPIPIPSGVKVEVKAGKVGVQGPQGRLEFALRPEVSVEVAGGVALVKRGSDDRQSRALHGLTRAILKNMVQGVAQGYEKILQIEGVGYRAQLQGKDLVLAVGFANQIRMQAPTGVIVEVPDQVRIIIRGPDKQKVGQFAAEVRAVRPPEPYKGKGIRYMGEVVRRKAGKTFVGGAAS